MKQFIKNHPLLFIFIVGLLLFAVPLPIREQSGGTVLPIYCTQEMSTATRNGGLYAQYKGCVIGEKVGIMQQENITYRTNYLHLAIRGFGLLMALVVGAIWAFKLLFLVVHKISAAIQRKK